MAKIPDSFYFDNFSGCIRSSCQAAHLLGETMHNFDAAKLQQKMEEIHAIEHAGDLQKHDLINTLVKAFITPIEREDLLLLSQSIDEVTDKLEDVFIRLYCNNVTSIRPDALKLVDIIIDCCEAVQKMLDEFSNYKKNQNSSRPRRTYQYIGRRCRPFVYRRSSQSAYKLFRSYRDHRMA